ncbi:MAG: type I 3-dehydroquinate dehydratase [Bacillota bacterium]|nr:type I 3-dehydroquinate dehydratase [Bacillota bacterium]
MIQLKVRDMILQPGRPKVAVPIISSMPADIIAECEAIKEMPCDLIEWRADNYLASIEDLEGYLNDKNGYLDMVKILDDINYIAGEKPVIFTVRSENQGGKVQVTRSQLEALYGIAAETKLVDFVDIELMDENGVVHEDWIREQIDEAHRHDVKVILSHHDHEEMPSPNTLIELVKKMYMMGADICKVAAKAENKADSENLLKVTAYLTKNNIGPVIMIAMGEAGRAVRVAGGKYGSCVTFAVGKGESAPGQADTYTMKNWLDKYYGM